EAAIPWYLRDDKLSSELNEVKQIDLPEVPENAPKSVDIFLNLLGHEYGMENIHLFDLTKLDEEHDFHNSKQPAEYIIICTGKSEKHIFKAASELRLNIKHNHDILPDVEGMVGSAQTAVQRRRMLKRARRGPPATMNDYGKAANSWVMCDTLIDNVHIHMLTEERREELNLESLWCKPEDLPKYTKQQKEVNDSDDIFIGIRRFHTMTPFARNYSTTNLYDSFRSEKVDLLTVESIHKTISDFNKGFNADKLNDYNIRRDLYKLIHLISPEIVSVDQITDTILDKYRSLSISLSNDLEEERVNDVIQYIKLLIDSPEFKDVSKEQSDQLFDKVSNFIAKLYRFSNLKFNLSSRPEIVPLLWRLTFVPQNNYIGSELIDRIIQDQIQIPTYSSDPSIVLASNRSRDVLTIIQHQNKDCIPTSRFNELVLFTYGNAANWDKFWSHWESAFKIFRHDSPSASIKSPAIENWVRLVVYLAARNDKSQMVNFLNKYWDSNSSITGSFIGDFAKNGSEFNTSDEKVAFIKAMDKILSTLQENSSS
ncbi:hypothetical protein HYPBUDRAFT_94965, partial [Hyphopichia burtonii NRRL Y-1933]